MAEPARGRTKWTGKSSRFVEFNGHKADTIVTGHLTQEQLNAYQQYFRAEEISSVLRRAHRPGMSVVRALPSHGAANFQREPSPPPQYDGSGNRTNTREARVLAQLEKERHALVELAVTSIRNYDPPVDYQKPAKTSEKLYIPIKDYPDINFVGLLLGPRGNTLRQLQDDSGAKLAIRGKGSVKDGKSYDAGSSSPEDDLHVVITADTTAKIHKAVQLTNDVIEKAVSSPVGQNDLKRDQLRELAVLNGTLRETKPYVPPDAFRSSRAPVKDITQIVCRVCGGVGHYSRDCKLKGPQPHLDSYTPGVKRPADDEPHWNKRTDSYTPPWASKASPGGSPAASAGATPVPTMPTRPTAPPSIAGPPPSIAGPPPSIAGPPPSIAGPPPSIAGPPPSVVAPPPPPSVIAPPPPPSVIAPPPPPSVVAPPPPPSVVAPPPPSAVAPPPPSVVAPPPPPSVVAPPPPSAVAPPPPPSAIAPPPPPAKSAPPPPPAAEKPQPPKETSPPASSS